MMLTMQMVMMLVWASTIAAYLLVLYDRGTLAIGSPSPSCCSPIRDYQRNANDSYSSLCCIRFSHSKLSPLHYCCTLKLNHLTNPRGHYVGISTKTERFRKVKDPLTLLYQVQPQIKVAGFALWLDNYAVKKRCNQQSPSSEEVGIFICNFFSMLFMQQILL